MLTTLLVLLVLLLIITFLPLDGQAKTIAYVAVLIVVLLWLLGGTNLLA